MALERHPMPTKTPEENAMSNSSSVVGECLSIFNKGMSQRREQDSNGWFLRNKWIAGQ